MVNIKTLQNYLNKKRIFNDIPLEKTNELANFYNVSLDYLLGLSNIKKEYKDH